MIAIGIILGLLVPLALIGLAARFVMRRVGSDAPVARTVGAVLHIGVVIAAVNAISGLLELLVGGDEIFRDTTRLVARDLAVLVVAVPVAVVVWRALFSGEIDFPRRLAVVGGLAIALVVTVFASVEVARAAFGLTELDASSLGDLLAFGGAWLGYEWWRRQNEPGEFEVDDLPATVASATGLGLTLSAIVLLIETALSRILGTGGDVVFERDPNESLLMVAILAVVGGAVSAVYWWRDLLGRETRFRNGYGAIVSYLSLTAWISAVATLAFVTLEWAFGVGADRIVDQFEPVPISVGVAVAFGLSWWHHLGTIDPRRGLARRAYSYATAATGLIAAASGLVSLLVLAIESITAIEATATSEVGSIVIAALIALLAGATLWWRQWRQIDPTDPEERDSTPRRVYLVGLLVTAGIAGGSSLITAIFGLLQAVLEGTLALETVHDGRFVIAIVLVTAPTVWYLVGELRDDRARRPAATAGRRVILVADGAGRLSDRNEIALLTPHGDGHPLTGDMAGELERLVESEGPPLLVIARPDGLETVELDSVPERGTFGIFG